MPIMIQIRKQFYPQVKAYQNQRVSVDKVYQVKVRVKGQNKVTEQSKVNSKNEVTEAVKW